MNKLIDRSPSSELAMLTRLLEEFANVKKCWCVDSSGILVVHPIEVVNVSTHENYLSPDNYYGDISYLRPGDPYKYSHYFSLSYSRRLFTSLECANRALAMRKLYGRFLTVSEWEYEPYQPSDR